jgi:AraC-like DNA-binding protein
MFFYKTYQPCAVLRPYVSSYSVVENETAVSHKILPRAAFILGIRYKGNMTLQSATKEVMRTGFTSGVMGIQDTCRIFSKDAGTGMLAINFTPIGAAALLRLPLNEIFNQAYPLHDFFCQRLIAELEERVTCAIDQVERIRITESFLQRIMGDYQQDQLIKEGVQLIQRAKGIIRADELAKQLFISPARLEKRFRSVVGTTPKKYASMIRIASILNGWRSGLSLTGLAQDFGYFDQAHFNHYFKDYTGVTPKQLLSPGMSANRDDQPPCGFVYASNVRMINKDLCD